MNTTIPAALLRQRARQIRSQRPTIPLSALDSYHYASDYVHSTLNNVHRVLTLSWREKGREGWLQRVKGKGEMMCRELFHHLIEVSLLERPSACLEIHSHYFQCILNSIWRSNFFVTFPFHQHRKECQWNSNDNPNTLKWKKYYRD